MAQHRTILCAPDSFKQSLTAVQAAQAMARGIRRIESFATTVDVCPIADGGEGSLDTLIAAMGGVIRSAIVIGPLGDPVEARWGVLSDNATAIIELAEASGLALVPHDQRDPAAATTFGTGQLIALAQAPPHRCQRIIVCIGGSATVDGGAGIAQALGAKFLDRNGRVIEQPMTGGVLREVASWRAPPRGSLPRIEVACDVTNPLCGPNGAAAVYGPQKGATALHVAQLEDALAHLARIVGGDPDMPGAGAAGGAGFGLVNMLGGKLQRGIDLVLNAVKFNDRCARADLVLTGEGRLDSQSLAGKACMGVAAAAHKLGVPTIAIVGSTGPGADDCVNSDRGGRLKSYFSLEEHYGRQRALHHAAECIERAAYDIVHAEFAKPA